MADTLNHRVLRFDAASAKATGAAADGLLLQPAFGIVNAGPAAALGNFPGGVCVTPQGRLFVADRGNRVVWFNNAASLPNGTVIHGMLGFTGNIVFPTPTNPHAWNNFLRPSACTLDDVGRLWVVDGGHARVLRFSPALDSTITGTGLDAQNHFTLTVRASRGETCEIRSSPDLQDWSTLDYTFRTSAIGLAFSTFTWTVPTAASGQRFYRLQAP